MKLRQLQYVHEVIRTGLNVSNAARALHTSQPGISRQILLLEEELGVDIFVRDKNRLVALTAHGEILAGYIGNALSCIRDISMLARSVTAQADENLTIVTSHTQARYILPAILREFAAAHPAVGASVRHCGVDEIEAQLLQGDADIAVMPVTPHNPDVLTFDCREYRRMVVVPKGHPLLALQTISLNDIATYPLITYEQSIPTRKQYADVFAAAGIRPNVVLNAINSDVIKACVESGMGVAILPSYVFSPARDTGLQARDAGHLFPPAHTMLALSRRKPLRAITADFIRLFAPEWTRAELERRLQAEPG